MIPQVRRFLDKTNAEDQSALYVNFASGSSFFAMPYQVAGGGGGTQVRFLYIIPHSSTLKLLRLLQGVNPFLLIYLNQGTDVHAEVHRTGAILMDFPGGVLINKILSFNFR
jgi:1-phosphatidylinositol phosphodiesterase